MPNKSGAFTGVLTTKQVCEMYPFLNAGTMRYRRHANLPPASFVINSRVLYRQSEVERWLADEEAATTRGGAA